MPAAALHPDKPMFQSPAALLNHELVRHETRQRCLTRAQCACIAALNNNRFRADCTLRWTIAVSEAHMASRRSHDGNGGRHFAVTRSCGDDVITHWCRGVDGKRRRCFTSSSDSRD